MSVTAVNGTEIDLHTPISLRNGSFIMSADGSYQYTPDAGFEGVETFSYLLTDTAGQSDSATVNIEVSQQHAQRAALNSQVDRLVSAMASFHELSGAGEITPGHIALDDSTSLLEGHFIQSKSALVEGIV